MIRNLLLTLLMFFQLPAAADSLTTQQRRAERVLWYEQKQFHLDQVLINIHVRRMKDMPDKDVWGEFRVTPDGPEIDILAIEDYEPGMSGRERIRQQKEIIVHELLHVVLIQAGVPDAAQDTIIEAVRPGVRIP